jgi:hypothetical protein
MTLTNPDFGNNWATFDFQVKEPPIVRGNILDYLTPRGLHICISQAGYAMVERMANEGLLEGLAVDSLRKILLEGRVKITELHEMFRREIGLLKPIPGKIELTRSRGGAVHIKRFTYDFGNKAFHGNWTSLIASQPTHQTNADLMRNPV